MPRLIISLNGWNCDVKVNMIHIPRSLNENLFFVKSDYLSLKIKHVFGWIQSWNPKIRKQESPALFDK